MTLDEARALSEDDFVGPGVYFLWYKGELQYIGHSANINSRLYMHHCSQRYGNQGGTYNVCIRHDRATTMPCDKESMRALEKALILELQPKFNKNFKR